MFRIHLMLLVLALSVSACASPPNSGFTTAPHRVAKPYLGSDGPLRRSRTHRPKQVAIRSASNAVSTDQDNLTREEMLRTLAPNSNAWWAVHDEIEAAKDRQLRQRLVICRGCFPVPAADDDATGSISRPRRD